MTAAQATGAKGTGKGRDGVVGYHSPFSPHPRTIEKDEESSAKELGSVRQRGRPRRCCPCQARCNRLPRLPRRLRKHCSARPTACPPVRESNSQVGGRERSGGGEIKGTEEKRMGGRTKGEPGWGGGRTAWKRRGGEGSGEARRERGSGEERDRGWDRATCVPAAGLPR